MNEQQYRYLISRVCQYARAISDEPISASRKMRESKICSSCKIALPDPHVRALKRCEFCSTKHLVYMHFRRRSGWHCGFRTEARKKLPREFTFHSSARLRGLARVGRGGIWLRLTDDQYLALGGVL